MKMITFILWSLFIVLCPLNTRADELPRLSSDCLEDMKIRDVEYNKSIMKEIITELGLDIDNQNYIEVSDKALDAAHLIYGGKEMDENYRSLHEQFIVASRGKPTLYIKPKEAYLLYKQPDNTNVAVHLKLADFKWDVVGKKKKEGNPVHYKLLKCEKEYLKKKREYFNQ
ncbi:hypothetical protein [Neobacillus cucumis]|uniref:Uncharacterized protein n=1 Tax=Neobacillus cucumis TaxID=1740721 RepID=A0A2N5HP51_9BACI|nr:hypothetical protein [Neobacillus cucumis]PLS07284.1 hypothetical protein CVD27_06285 [Neobacillus cucumis]